MRVHARRRLASLVGLSRENWRRAFVLQEVLGPPLSLRGPRPRPEMPSPPPPPPPRDDDEPTFLPRADFLR
ncbi:hypothetical protein HY251_16585 [bacterium]|nr:hypothetical protein [bacterium]